MAWRIPGRGTADSNIMSIFYSEFMDALVDGINGRNCVLSGLAVTGGADMTPAVAKGAVLSGGIMYPVAAADVTIGTAHASLPRIDLIVVTSAGALAVRAGTAAAAPTPPARTANDVLVAGVYVPASDTAIATSQIIDLRVVRGVGPICVYRTTTTETTNNTTSAIHILNKTGSGVVIPSGLFATGRILRVRIMGNVLINSGTPTLSLSILFGGSAIFTDTSAVSVADADRRAFVLDFDLISQGATDQALVGRLSINDFGAGITGSAVGIGDAFPGAATQEAEAVFAGGLSVDWDAADRTLAVTWTFNVANAADEIVVEGATVELI